MFELTYKRYKKVGCIQEVLLVDDDGKVDFYHVGCGAYSFGDLLPERFETEELEPRRNY